MKNQDLISALVTEGLLTQEDGSRVLREADSVKKTAEEVIYSDNLVSEDDVAKIKSRILKIPFKKIDVASISEDLVKLIPFDNARSFKMTPMSRTQDMIVVGMVNPDDTQAQQALKFLASREKVNLGVYIVTPSDVYAVINKYNPISDEIKEALSFLKSEKGADEFKSFQKIIKLDEASSSNKEIGAPIIRIVSGLLKEAVGAKASDIHIEPGRLKTRVRFRLNGNLEEYTSFPPELSQAIVSRVKILSSLKLDETRIPQDGRFRTMIFEKEIDFRVSTFPTPNGEKVALRVLDSATGLKNLEDLGIVGQSSEILRRAIERAYGMVLLTGPTGSGKTTTLYALMKILNKENVNVMSLEDPVEYTIEGINQSQIKPEIGYSFASGLREILRQDPDILMVGEIRDKETADLAVNAALTGHILLSTLHTNNAVGVIPRLIDLGVSGYLLPSAISAMAGQRLISKLCDNCKTSHDPSPEILNVIKKELSSIQSKFQIKEPFKVYKANGCKVCKNKGIVGRVAIFEVFEMTKELSQILAGKNFSENDISKEAERQGMVSLRQDGIIKALQGLVSIEDVISETEVV